MFRVRGEQTAVNELASLWTDANSALRQRITMTVEQMDQQLQTDPMAASESRSADERIYLSSPLGIVFRMEADGQTVSVLHIWLFRNRNK